MGEAQMAARVTFRPGSAVPREMLKPMDEVSSGSDTPDDSRPPTPGRRRWLRAAVITVALIATVVVLRDKLPPPHQVASAIRSAQPGWLLLGSVAEGVSMSMFARQQLWLLRGFGVSTTIWRSLAVTYSRSAIAISMPAGSAVSAGFAYRAFRTWGASPEVAGTVMMLSGLLSSVGLGLLCMFGFFALLLTQPASTVHTYPLGTAIAVSAAVALAAFSAWSTANARRADGARWGSRSAEAGTAKPASPARRLVGLGRRIGTVALTMPLRHRRVALTFAVANWLADLCCLVAVAQAFHLPLSFYQLGTVYVLVQLVRQVPVTPGGVGVIEASLLASLVAAGASQGPAGAVVLGYRLFSAWLIIPAGLFAWALLRRRQAPSTG
jgi:uncharacterized protein (TIRG00374 family)